MACKGSSKEAWAEGDLVWCPRRQLLGKVVSSHPRAWVDVRWTERTGKVYTLRHAWRDPMLNRPPTE